MMGPVFWFRHRHKIQLPTGSPYLADYDFTGGTLPSGTSLTRSSVATYFNSSSYLASADINTARFDHDPVTGAFKGLLLEGQSSNIQRYSNIGDGTGWTADRATVSVDASIIDSFGGNNATKFADTTDNTMHRLYAGVITTITSGEKYTLSVYVKAGTYSVVGMSSGSTTGLGWAAFDLANVVVGNSSTSGTPFITPLANGWFRVGIRGATSSLTGTPTAGVILFLMNNNPNATYNAPQGQPAYIGDGSYVYVSTAQIESELVETSPILNVVSTTVTRAADQQLLNVPNGGSLLRLIFDDESTQDFEVTAYAGASYALDPTLLDRRHLKRAVIL
ncbi:MAG: hypothetical protein EOM37_04830 [Proteobacteria bacterium]|nr:hypothetical protein [Pseudomonadota bacterium]